MRKILLAAITILCCQNAIPADSDLLAQQWYKDAKNACVKEPFPQADAASIKACAELGQKLGGQCSTLACRRLAQCWGNMSFLLQQARDVPPDAPAAKEMRKRLTGCLAREDDINFPIDIPSPVTPPTPSNETF